VATRLSSVKSISLGARQVLLAAVTPLHLRLGLPNLGKPNLTQTVIGRPGANPPEVPLATPRRRCLRGYRRCLRRGSRLLVQRYLGTGRAERPGDRCVSQLGLCRRGQGRGDFADADGGFLPERQDDRDRPGLHDAGRRRHQPVRDLAGQRDRGVGHQGRCPGRQLQQLLQQPGNRDDDRRHAPGRQAQRLRQPAEHRVRLPGRRGSSSAACRAATD
jgi:hypothetical protein